MIDRTYRVHYITYIHTYIHTEYMITNKSSRAGNASYPHDGMTSPSPSMGRGGRAYVYLMPGIDPPSSSPLFPVIPLFSLPYFDFQGFFRDKIKFGRGTPLQSKFLLVPISISHTVRFFYFFKKKSLSHTNLPYEYVTKYLGEI